MQEIHEKNTNKYWGIYSCEKQALVWGQVKLVFTIKSLQMYAKKK